MEKIEEKEGKGNKGMKFPSLECQKEKGWKQRKRNQKGALCYILEKINPFNITKVWKKDT